MSYKPKPKQSTYTWRDSFPSFDDPAAFIAGDPRGYIIAFSGGKDSCCLMDQALRVTEDPDLIQPYIMSLLPDMDYYRFWIDWAKKRWGVTVREYQHWALSWYVRRGIFRGRRDPTFPSMTLSDVERQVREDTGLRWIGYGYKSIDSLQRRGMMSRWNMGISHERSVFSPLKSWSPIHVNEYLKRRHLFQPTLKEYQSRGIDLSPQCMWWLREYWPRDHERILKIFPLAIAQADRYLMLQDSNKSGVQRAARNMVNINGGGKFPDSALEPNLD